MPGLRQGDTPAVTSQFYGQMENSVEHPIISRIHYLTGIPESILRKHWKTTEEVVAFSQQIDKSDTKYLPAVLHQFQNKIASLGNKYYEAMAPSFKRAIEAASNAIKPPAMKTPPLGINPEALIFWRAVIKNRKKEIKSYSDNTEKWAVAIIRFKELCVKNGVAPFMDGRVAKQPTKSPITTFLASYVDPCIGTVDEMVKFLSKKNMVGKQVAKKFKLTDIGKEGNVTLVTASKNLKLIKGETAASVVVYMMPKFGLKKTENRGTFKKKCGTYANVLVSYKKKTDTSLSLSIQIRIRPKLWRSLESEKKDPQKFMKSWISRGFKATGDAEEIPESNELLIKQYYSAENIEDAAALLTKFDLPTIVNTGTGDFQVTLAKHLRSLAEEFDFPGPPLIDRFIEDADFREYVRQNHSSQLPEEEEETEGTPEGQLIR